MKTTLFRSLFWTTGLLLGLSLRAEPVLVGHSSLKGQVLAGDELKAVLLGKKVTIGDARVVLIVAKAGDHQDALLKQSVGMTTSQFTNYWRRLFMTGGGSAPKSVETEADAAKLVSETAGAIAIVDSTQAGALSVLSK